MEPVLTAIDIEKIKKPRIILGSGSIRRRELLESIGLKVEVQVKDIDEDFPDNLTGPDIAMFLSNSKINRFKPLKEENTVVLTADTIVICDGKVLGKPADREEAISMIRMLSGKTHQVITALSLLTLHQEKSFFETTLVTFENLSENLIEYYVDRYRPFDKAGGYGIQEFIGIVGCSRIEGSYLNVVGLPVSRFLKELISIIS
ncbi:MAG: Maf family nucleotide pyrophosphatase [Bacteroidales bacterium]|jgi:septum formation protein